MDQSEAVLVSVCRRSDEGHMSPQMIPLDSFVGQSADGKMVPIIPGGNSIPLTFSNRKEYVERAVEYRLHEIDRQVGPQCLSLHARTF